MPRKSAAALLVADDDDVARPEPLGGLTEEEAVEWRAVVESLPVGWFPRETLGVLAQFCRMRARARYLSRLVAQAKGDGNDKLGEEAMERLNRLLRLEIAVTDQIGALSSKMRLTQQATRRIDYVTKLKPSLAASAKKKLWD